MKLPRTTYTIGETVRGAMLHMLQRMEEIASARLGGPVELMSTSAYATGEEMTLGAMWKSADDGTEQQMADQRLAA